MVEHQKVVPVDEKPTIRELSVVQAQSILDAEAARARHRFLQKLRNKNDEVLRIAQETAVENEKLLNYSCGEHLEHTDRDILSVGTRSVAAKARRKFRCRSAWIPGRGQLSASAIPEVQ